MMINNIKLILILFLCTSSIASPHLKEAITNMSEDIWASKGATGGGYVFKIEVDILGDKKTETLINYSLDTNQGFFIYTQEQDPLKDSAIGEIGWGILEQPYTRHSSSTIFYGTIAVGSMPYDELAPHTKAVISHQVSAEGIKEVTRIVGTLPGSVADPQYNMIRYNPKDIPEVAFLDLNITYKKIQDYLKNTGTWSKFNKDEWRELMGGNIFVKKSDISSSNLKVPQELSHTFSRKMALEQLEKVILKPRSVNFSTKEKNTRSLQRSSKSNYSLQDLNDELKVNSAPSKRSRVIVGILIVIALVLLFKKFKPKSAA